MEHVESSDSCGSLLYLDLHGESREIWGGLVQALCFTFFELDVIWGVAHVLLSR